MFDDVWMLQSMALIEFHEWMDIIRDTFNDIDL